MRKILIVLTVFLLVRWFAFADIHAQELGDALALGDSLTAGLARVSGVGIVCAAQGNRIVPAADQRSCKGNGQEGVGGWPPLLKNLTEARIYNYGNSGERTLEMLSRFEGHLSERDSDFVLILAGTNDMIFGDSVELTIGNINTLVQATLDAGRTPIVATLPPLLGGSRASVNTRVVQLNERIRLLPQQFKGLAIAEIYNRVISGWPATFSADTVHFNDAGNQLVSDAWFQAMKKSRSSAFLAPVYELLLGDD